jgi:hypothetical protein
MQQLILLLTSFLLGCGFPSFLIGFYSIRIWESRLRSLSFVGSGSSSVLFHYVRSLCQLGGINFMSSILTCGPFLHITLIWATGRVFLLNTSSMPLDDAPTTPTVTTRSRPAAAILVPYFTLPTLSKVVSKFARQKLRILPQVGFLGDRESCRQQGLSFII